MSTKYYEARTRVSICTYDSVKERADILAEANSTVDAIFFLVKVIAEKEVD